VSLPATTPPDQPDPARDPTVDVAGDPTVDLMMRFDLRVPPFAATTHAAQHQAALEMAEWAEAVGVAEITLSEHHGDPAGFTPAPITVAAAVLARTRRVRVNISAALVPLHDPVRLAEQLATVDCLAPGRVSAVLGAGYRRVEFEMAGVERSQRGALVEECWEVCHRAWTGEPFIWRGRTVLVTPRPGTPGGPHLAIGGKTEVAARRAARLDAPFAPASADPALAEAYRAECARLGFAPRLEGLGARPMGPGFVMVAEDPDATWAQVSRHAWYDAETYASWQDDGVVSDWVVPDVQAVEDLRTSGRYVVCTPGECVDLAREHGRLTLHPLMGGIAPDVAWDSLRLIESAVLPHLGPAPEPRPGRGASADRRSP
jgi:alkanesulfonate monooxygenase SsuD/methylene tetrahydromethanopterin reductase-like flavin-dependent oxidoreductase (luciferase family)